MARGSFSGGQRRGRGGSRFGTRGSTHFRGGRGRGRGRGGAHANDGPGPKRDDEGTQLEERFEQVRVQDEVDEKLGFTRISEGPMKEGWLVNMHPVCDYSFRSLVDDLIHARRHWSKTRIGLEARLQLIFSLFKTTAVCSNARCNTSRTSI